MPAKKIEEPFLEDSFNQTNNSFCVSVSNQYNDQITVQNDQIGLKELENVLPLKSVILLSQNKLKILLTCFGILITGFLLGLVLLWYIPLRKIMLYDLQKNIEDATHVFLIGEGGDVQIQKLEFCMVQKQKYFIYQLLKYFFNGKNNQFYSIECDFINMRTENILKQHFKGLSEQQVVKQQQKFGKCKIEIPPINFFVFFFLQITQPFYLLAYFSSFVWVLQGVYFAAVFFLAVIFVFPIINYFQISKSNNKIRKLVENNQNIKVFRNNNDNFKNYQIIKSEELVPGDLFVIENNMKIPCDCLLISGEILLNEQSLTGESLPIPKSAIEETQNRFDYQKTHKKNTMLEGTTVMKEKPLKHYFTIALVLRTGFTSFKGHIFRGVLFPTSQFYPFYKNALIYCLIFMFISCIIGIPLSIFMKNNGFENFMIIANYVTILIQNLPPAVPIFINSICTIAVSRFSKHQILCSDPKKIIPASKIQIMCFDKTGTLTQQGMQVYGYSLASNLQITQEINFNQISINEKSEFQILFNQFATCHGVYIINGEQIGDLLDVSMFQYSKFSIENKQNEDKNIKFSVKCDQNNIRLQVLKTFEFESELQRMSCIVRDEITNKCYFYCKGSPEIIQQLSKKETLNQEKYKKQIQNLGLKGLRLISFAYKEIKFVDDIFNLEQLNREDFEKDLIFSGIIAFQNQLKDDTQENIEILQQANIETKVISGDNPLTTIQTAKQASLIQANQNVILIQQDLDGMLMYQTFEYGAKDEYIVRDYHVEEQVTLRNYLEELLKYLKKNVQYSSNFRLAITGCGLLFLQNQQKSGQTEKIKDIAKNLIQLITLYGSIFSRMKPIQKAEIVEYIQEQGISVGMIGDGSNDCSAIKQADVGISFSSCDAGLSAPFSGENTESIKIIVYILKQGKCSMQSIIDTVKGFIVLNLLKFIVNLLITYQFAILGSGQQIFLQLMQILGVYMIGYMKTPEKLSPIPINDNLISAHSLIQTIVQMVLGSTSLILSYFYMTKQNDFTEQYFNDKENNGYNSYGDANMGMFLSLTAINGFFIYSISCSYPFKKSVLKCIQMIVVISVFFIYDIFVTISPVFAIGGLELQGKNFNLLENNNFRWIIFGINVGFGILVVIIEKFVIENFLGNKKRMRKFRNFSLVNKGLSPIQIFQLYQKSN